MDGSIYSDHIYANAALRQGWIDPGSKIRQHGHLSFASSTNDKKCYISAHYTLINLQKRTLPQLLRPNLIIYLDAPVEVVSIASFC